MIVVLLVARKVDAARASQDLEELLQCLGVAERELGGGSWRCADSEELTRDLDRCQHEVHASGRYGALRHTAVFGTIVLSEGHPTFGFDGLDSRGSVKARSGQYDGNRGNGFIGGE